MISQNAITSPNLRKTFNALRKYFETAEKEGFVNFDKYLFLEIRDQLITDFEEWITAVESKSDILKTEQEKFILSSFRKRMESAFDQYVIRGFAQAINAIIKNSRFGRAALSRITGKKIESKAIEGYSRLTSKGKIYTINLLNYVHLIIITMQAEFIRERAKVETLISGIRLVKIDNHPASLGPSAKEVCNKWRGKIISVVSGVQGFDSIDDAKKENMFHPHCTHSFKPLTEEENILALRDKIQYYTTLKQRLKNGR